jgi:hypothetical protein
MRKITETLKSPFAFLFAKPQAEELVAEHIIREHHRGRALPDILDDAYVTNHLAPDKINRVLERPDVLEAIGDDIAAESRRT